MIEAKTTDVRSAAEATNWMNAEWDREADSYMRKAMAADRVAAEAASKKLEAENRACAAEQEASEATRHVQIVLDHTSQSCRETIACVKQAIAKQIDLAYAG